MISKKFYEKHILPSLINSTCSSRPIKIQKQKVIPSAYGNILEIGFGSGVNLQFYDKSATKKITGVDPSVELHELAMTNAEGIDLDIELIKGSAEDLPFKMILLILLFVPILFAPYLILKSRSLKFLES